jgi:hypothetical protein
MSVTRLMFDQDRPSILAQVVAVFCEKKSMCVRVVGEPHRVQVYSDQASIWQQKMSISIFVDKGAFWCLGRPTDWYPGPGGWAAIPLNLERPQADKSRR